MEYGTFIGLTWGGMFLTYVEGISYNNGLLMLLCFMLGGVALVLPFVLAFRLNRKMALAGEHLSYFQGLFFAFSMFMYGCLLNGLNTTPCQGTLGRHADEQQRCQSGC